MQVASSTHNLRERLEGRWDVLEVTRLRYRALVEMLRAWSWRDRLRRNLPLVHQVVLAQTVVDGVLERTLRRAEAEAWPAGDTTTRLLREVESLRRQLCEQLQRRLGDKPGPGVPLLPEQLLELENVLASQYRPQASRPWASALSVLPWSLPELIRASERGELLERLMKRPLDLEQARPFSAEEVALLSRTVPEAENALQAVWNRVDKLEPTGDLRRFLVQRSRRAPLRPPRSGPEALLRAAFWLDYTRAAIRRWVEARVVPVAVADCELWPLLRWLHALQLEPASRLPSSETLSEGRAGLFELAHELARSSRRVVPAALPPAEMKNRLSEELTDSRWDRLVDRARRAEPVRDTSDASAVRHVLTRFIRMRAADRASQMAALEESTLEALVNRAAASSGEEDSARNRRSGSLF